MTYQMQTGSRAAARRAARRRKRSRAGRRLAGLIVLLFIVFGGIQLMRGLLGTALLYIGGPVDLAAAAAEWHKEGIAVEDGTLQAITALAEEDSRARDIVEHPERYPASMLDALAKNAEMLEFVCNYPKNHDKAPAKKLDENLDTVPLLLQWDARWGYQPYGDSSVAVSGCAPTCVAMAACYLTGDSSITPNAVAQYAAGQGYYVSGSGTSWELLHTGVEHFGMVSQELPLDESQINAAIDGGEPVICCMKPGDFTTSGHFIVLYGRTESGYRLRDPNSMERSGQVWSYERLSGQISNLWACRKA